MIELNNRGRFLIIVMGAALCLMLAVSLYKRFTQPGLTVNRFDAQAEQQQPARMDDMEIVGKLMQQVAKNPGDKEAVLSLVESLMAMGQWQSAENFAHKALSLESADNPDPRPLYLLALIHHNQGQHAQAAELLEKLLEKSETAPARYSLGILYLHYLNNPKAGIGHLRKGLADEKASAGLKTAMREELEKAVGFEENAAKNPVEGENNQESVKNDAMDAP